MLIDGGCNVRNVLPRRLAVNVALVGHVRRRFLIRHMLLGAIATTQSGGFLEFFIQHLVSGLLSSCKELPDVVHRIPDLPCVTLMVKLVRLALDFRFSEVTF